MKRQIRQIYGSNLSFSAYASPMKTLMENICAVLMIIILLPYVFTVLFQGNQLKNGIVREHTEWESEQENSRGWVVRKGGEDRMAVEEYVTGAVVASIPAFYESETLKAQAVIIRTYILLALQGQDTIQEEELKLTYLDAGELQTIWGYREFTGLYEKLTDAVKATEGQVLVYQGELIYPPFHAVSAGRTRSGNEIAGRQVYPYLVSVDSSMDLESEDFLKIEYYERSELTARLRTLDETIILNGNAAEEIEIEREKDSDYVKNVSFENGRVTMTGEQFRELFGLNSTCFSVEDYEGKFRIVTKGLGHGIGFSEYGANQMARQGSTFKTLLQYYFSGVSLKTMNNL